jgi:hypothetical protein
MRKPLHADMVISTRGSFAPRRSRRMNQADANAVGDLADDD